MYEMVVILSLFINGEKTPIMNYKNDYIFRSETGCYVSLVVDRHSITNALIRDENISRDVVEQLYFEGYCNEVE